MHHLAGKNHLALETVEIARVRRNLRPDDLQRDPVSLQKLVFDLIHLAHAAASDKADDQETARDDLPWIKAFRGTL